MQKNIAILRKENQNAKEQLSALNTERRTLRQKNEQLMQRYDKLN